MFQFVNRGPLMDAADDAKGAGGGDKQTFDPAAFKSELLGDFDKKLNATMKGYKTDFAKMLKDAFPPREDKQDDKKADDKKADDQNAGGDDKKVDPEKNALILENKKLKTDSEARIKALEQKNEDTAKHAAESERLSEIRTLLSKLQYASDNAAETAFTIYGAKIQRDPDTGKLVAGDLPANKFIETDIATNHPYLLAPKDLGGAGARGGNKGAENKKYNMDRNSGSYALRPENFRKFSPVEQAEIRQLVATS